jgi:hypothetical protein
MACTATRATVLAALIGILERMRPDYRPITEDTPLGDDGLGMDDDSTADLFVPVSDWLQTQGCRMKGVSPTSFKSSMAVGELADLISKSLEDAEEGAMLAADSVTEGKSQKISTATPKPAPKKSVAKKAKKVATRKRT